MSVFLLVNVAKIAKTLGCSDRRVRALLAQGRIKGYRQGNGRWWVYWPLDIRPGTRGPDLRQMATRHFLKPTKAVSPPRQGSGLPEARKSHPAPSGEVALKRATSGRD